MMSDFAFYVLVVLFVAFAILVAKRVAGCLLKIIITLGLIGALIMAYFLLFA